MWKQKLHFYSPDKHFTPQTTFLHPVLHEAWRAWFVTQNSRTLTLQQMSHRKHFHVRIDQRTEQISTQWHR